MGEGSSGCVKFGSIGCLIVLIVGVGLGVYAYRKAFELGGDALEKGAEAGMTELGLPTDEVEAAMKPVRELAAKVRNRKIRVKQAVAIGAALAQGPVLATVMMRVFEVKYIDPSDLPAAEKRRAKTSASRFAHGLVAEKIPTSEAEKIQAIVTVTTTNSQGETTTNLKPNLTTEELRKCVAIAKKAADEAGIENRLFKIDLAAEVEAAIEKGMQQRP